MPVSLRLELDHELEVLACLRGRPRVQWLYSHVASWPDTLHRYGVDHLTYVSCLCRYARLTLPRSSQDHLPRLAIEATERWVELASEPRRQRSQEDRLHVLIRDLNRRTRLAVPGRSRGEGTLPAQAALSAALSTREPVHGSVIGSLALDSQRGSEDNSALEALALSVLSWSWPVMTRLPSAPLRPALQVAWDWLCEHIDASPTRTTSELLGASRLERVLGVRVPASASWSEPERQVLRGLTQGVVLTTTREQFLDRLCFILWSQ